MTYGNAPRTQAEWDANRAKVKAKAAKTIKSEAAKARKARDKIKRVGLDREVTAPELTTEEVVVDEKTEDKSEDKA